jgi:hypothetical protein
MSAEAVIIFAHASGRTLVLPPTAKWYLLDKNKGKNCNYLSIYVIIYIYLIYMELFILSI